MQEGSNMISYATVGTNDPAKALPFYDALMKEMGASRLFDHPSGGAVYGKTGPSFGVLRPFDGNPATVGNGSMAGFALDSREDVDRFHEKVLALGGTCEGAPGLRGPEEMGFYFTYVRDLDGNKLCAFKLG